jgi:MFS transporter, DHA2 family, methylenomycin A resistance protein
LAIISHAHPEGPAQARAIGVWAGIGSLALPAGPLLGGLLISAFGWRAIFLVNVPIVVAACLAASSIVKKSTGARGRRLDPAGAMLGVLTLLAITFAFIEAGRSGAGSPTALGAGAAAVCLAGLFLLVERHRGWAAMLPLPLLRRPAYGAAATMNMCTLGTLFLLTLFMQSVQHHSPLMAGVEVIPLFAPLAIIAPVAGRLTSKIGPRLPIFGGLMIAAFGLVLLVPLGPDSRYLVALPAFLLWGIGLGILTPAVVAAAIAAVPRERAGLASAINNTARQAGGAIGIAVAGAVAGQPSATDSFVAGFHSVAIASAVLYAIAVAAAAGLVPSFRAR